MSYETEEQQVERLKEWWNDNGTPLVVGAVLGLSAFFGWKYWEHQEVSYQESASDLYLKVSEILESEKKEGLAESAEAVKSEFPKSSYAILSAFQLARLAVENKELDKAAVELNWVLDNHQDNELSAIASIRLARVLIEQKKYQQALPLVEMEENSGYYALANMVKGNAFLAMNKKDDALAAYQIASADKGVISRNPALKIKIDQLTSEKVNLSKTVSKEADTTKNVKVSEPETGGSDTQVTVVDNQSASDASTVKQVTLKPVEKTQEKTKQEKNGEVK